ncbi:MAG: hypothetical protein ACM3OC_07080, partial [Deltaproteobacteria bacterium]
SAYFQMKTNWQRQRDYLEALTNAQWAIEYCGSSLRQAEGGKNAGTKLTGGGINLKYMINQSGVEQEQFLWRGNTLNAYDERGKLYHCIKDKAGSNPPGACNESTIVEVANLIVDNPGAGKADDFFRRQTNGQNKDKWIDLLITCGKGGQNVTLFTRVKLRNEVPKP